MFEILSEFLILDQEKESKYLSINECNYENKCCHCLRCLHTFKCWRICYWIYWNEDEFDYEFLFKIQSDNLAFKVTKHDKISNTVEIIVNDNFITKCHKLYWSILLNQTKNSEEADF